MEIVFKKSAEKELLFLPKPLAKRVFQKISLLANNPYGQGSQKLEEGRGYRTRIGDHRVVYTIDKKNRIIFIIKIGHRREIYR